MSEDGHALLGGRQNGCFARALSFTSGRLAALQRECG